MAAFVTIALIATPLWFLSSDISKSSSFRNTQPVSDSLPTSPDTTRIRIGFVGDIMAHITQVKAQKVNDSTYNFSDNFTRVAPLFSTLDLMIGNLETVFGGATIPYSTHPYFNTPDALAEALKNAGFDLLATANNHMIDQGAAGMKRTIEIIRKNGLKSTGTRLSEREPRYLLESINGIKVAVAAFTYESGRAKDEVLINGLKVNRENKMLVNSFTPFDIKEAMDSLRAVTSAMLSDSSDLQIIIMHWGDEYKTAPNAFQRSLADSLFTMGIDIIFGSHPHVIQPVKVAFDSATGNKRVVAFSCGNFISNHRFETKGNYYTEDGLCVTIEIEKIGNEAARVSDVSKIPLWVNKYWKEGRNHFEVVPIESVLSDTASMKAFSKAQIARMKASWRRSAAILEMKTIR